MHQCKLQELEENYNLRKTLGLQQKYFYLINQISKSKNNNFLIFFVKLEIAGGFSYFKYEVK